MDKIALLLFIYFSTIFNCFSQNSNYLKKYSYFCFTKPVNPVVHTGTCFFYKKGGETYVITNYHVMYGMDPILGRQTHLSDTLIVVYPVPNSRNNKFSIVELGKDKVKIFNHFQHIDLAYHLIKIPLNFKINYINDLIDKDYLKTAPNKLIIYGYPADLQPINILNEKPVIDSVVGNYHNYYQNYNWSQLKYEAKESIAQKEFEMTGYLRKGFSGSPVFGEFYKKNKKIYKLRGLLSPGRKKANAANCINLNSVYNFLPR